MRVAVILCTLAVLPSTAWADCVYTGAKRAYLECIYNEALTAASGLATVVVDLFTLTSRVDTAESDLSLVESRVTTTEADLGALASRTSATEDAILGIYAENDGLETTILGVASDVAATETRLDALEAGGGGTTWRTVCTRLASSASGSNICSYVWLAANCSNGVPTGTCVGFISWAQHSGDDEDWRVMTPGESANGVSFPTGGMQWWNDQGCNNADVAIRAVYDCEM